MKATILNEIINRKNGVMTRVSYRSDYTKKLSAQSRKEGYTVEKLTATTARVGCNYNNMKAVIKRKAESENPPREYKNPYEWVVNNKIKVHKEKGTQYLVLGTIPSKQANTKSVYIIKKGATVVDVVEHLSDEYKALFVKSAFPTDKDNKPVRPDVISINLDNVISFNGIA